MASRERHPTAPGHRVSLVPARHHTTRRGCDTDYCSAYTRVQTSAHSAPIQVVRRCTRWQACICCPGMVVGPTKTAAAAAQRRGEATVVPEAGIQFLARKTESSSLSAGFGTNLIAFCANSTVAGQPTGWSWPDTRYLWYKAERLACVYQRLPPSSLSFLSRYRLTLARSIGTFSCN